LYFFVSQNEAFLELGTPSLRLRLRKFLEDEGEEMQRTCICSIAG